MKFLSAKYGMGKKLDTTFIVLLVLVSVAIAVSFWQGGWQLVASGFIQAGELLESVWLRLLLGLIFAGLIQVLVPPEWISKWIGPTSGIKGILIASYTSVFLAGNPYIWLPVIASLYKSGAGVGPVIALITARGILSINLLLVWQVPFFGIELALARYIVCLFVPPVIGLAGERVIRTLDRLFPPVPNGPSKSGVSETEKDGLNIPKNDHKRGSR